MSRRTIAILAICACVLAWPIIAQAAAGLPMDAEGVLGSGGVVTLPVALVYSVHLVTDRLQRAADRACDVADRWRECVKDRPIGRVLVQVDPNLRAFPDDPTGGIQR